MSPYTLSGVGKERIKETIADRMINTTTPTTAANAAITTGTGLSVVRSVMDAMNTMTAYAGDQMLVSRLSTSMATEVLVLQQ